MSSSVPTINPPPSGISTPTPTSPSKHHFTLRPRVAADHPALEALLEKQQPSSKYPIEWPLPFPVRDFIERDNELAAFVATTPSGEVLGHVSVCACTDPPKDADEGELAALWAKAHGRGCEATDLRVIGVLFTDPDWAGRGVGSALFRKATEVARSEGGRPVLNCVSTKAAPLTFYEKRGWKRADEWRCDHWIPGTELLLYLYILEDQ